MAEEVVQSTGSSTARQCLLLTVEVWYPANAPLHAGLIQPMVGFGAFGSKPDTVRDARFEWFELAPSGLFVDKDP